MTDTLSDSRNMGPNNVYCVVCFESRKQSNKPSLVLKYFPVEKKTQDFLLNVFRAKHNVDRYYAVVAVLEDIDKSLMVLEHFVPKFFTGVGEAYKDTRRQRSNLNRRVMNENLYKPKKPNNFDQIRNILVANFTKEIEFYEYCKARLHKQYLSIF